MGDEKSDLRAVLVDKAMALLAEGTAEISLRSVARAAGVSAMAPYRHFADKAALLGAVAETGFADLRTVLEAADARAEGRGALVEQGLAYIAFAQARPALFRLMFASAETVQLKAPVGAHAFGVLGRRVAEVMPASQEGWVLACWSIVHGMAMLALDGRIAVQPAQARQALGLMLGLD